MALFCLLIIIAAFYFGGPIFGLISLLILTLLPLEGSIE